MKTEIKYTREQYLNGKCTHAEYFAQFVNDYILAMVESRITKKEIIEALKTDEHLNNIPLQRWDMLALRLCNVSDKMKAAGDFFTISGGVCICKEAARQIAKNKK